ncbi:uncharacterized protein LOC132281019 [Cornus florida]|uniref:uncharacterized protein LOC132281019 n=1 Tax=Cornus florida TaxID=4283 RepID=UPI0028980517|nr:uncharacterized protein LOC132281019 [Cornus florida]
MVSKIIKKKTIKDPRSRCCGRRRKNSSIKRVTSTASSIVLTSIKKSIRACRRLIKIFSKLARFGTSKNPQKQGYQYLKKAPEDDTTHSCQLFDNGLLPTMWPEKKTVILDLDETLVHSKSDPAPEKYDFVVRPVINGRKMNFYVLKRPFVKELLEALSRKFEIVVFTAGIEEYASLVLRRIDQKGVISHRLYRNSCTEVDGKFVKDLSQLGRNLKSVVIVDDNPNSYGFQPQNGIPIRPFTDDTGDVELRRLIDFFEGSHCFEDMRDAVKHYLAEENKKLDSCFFFPQFS